MARAGDVRILAIEASGVTASVNGPGEKAFAVRIALEKLPDPVMAQAVDAMAGKASFAAALLSGTIPNDIEAAFEGTGRTLLPKKSEELILSCECGDQAAICSHAAAVAYLLGEQFDGDPFLIFLLRGAPRAGLLLALNEARARVQVTATGDSANRARRVTDPISRTPMPDVKPEHFFKPLLPVATLRTTFSPPEHPEAILTRLGPSPLQDPESARLLLDLHRAIGIGAAERMEEWEWRRVWGRQNKRPQER